MPRWRQDPVTHKLIPIDEAAARRDGVAIHGDIDSFVSPIDGTVITGRRGYDEHCKKHGVVPAQEFTPEFYAQKAKERADHYEGRHSTAETWKRRANIHEIINSLERK